MLDTVMELPAEWLDALKAAPGDYTLRLVLADWLMEQGEDVLAEGLRWSVAKERRAGECGSWGADGSMAAYSSNNEGRLLPWWLWEKCCEIIFTKGLRQCHECPPWRLAVAWSLCSVSERQQLWEWNYGAD